MSGKLARGVAFLTRSLGGTARITRQKRDGCYYVNVSLNVCPFLTPKKVNRWNCQPHNKAPKNNIVGIENVRAERCRCLLIEHPDHLYITDDFIVTHNTGINLDDTEGDKPRSMIIMTPPFTA